MKRLPAGPVSYQLWPDAAPAAPSRFLLAVSWTQDPAPQGSKNAAPKTGGVCPACQRRKLIFASPPCPSCHCGPISMIYRESSKHLPPWRARVTHHARQAWRGAPAWDGPVTARMCFTLHRPDGHWRTGRNAHLLRDAAPRVPTGYPDVSKLARAVEDALVDACVLTDDARIWRYDHLAKVYPGHPAPADWLPGLPYALDAPGVVVHLEEGT